MQTSKTHFPLVSGLGYVLVGGLLAGAILAIFLFAPTEQTMGHAQRIVYVHVAVAWLGLLGLLVMAGTGIVYLARRRLAWDHWFQSAGELGWLCCGLTLATGSLWAHEAWGTWWVWDPRLTTSFILWLIYSGILIVRASLEDPHQRARIGAILAILGTLDIPLVVLATRWFRGMHPVSPEMAPTMRITLLVSVIGFTAFFVLLAVRRRAQLQLQCSADKLAREADM
ncbi:MAG: cytochrome c biogenesis protein CcsA [Planctomycetes bacterium]|nr:cytochrome c biogenesis protein CcsA [Planctomycetota bacterium]MBL7042445.1 cytochrome c biogenesis protein CcsA [Pirellulaceae bacterium]